MAGVNLGEKVEIHLPSKTKHLYAMRMLTRTLAESMGFGSKESESAALAVEEAVTNVIEHAYHGDPSRTLRIVYEMEEDRFTVRICHNGDQVDHSRFVAVEDLSDFYRQKKKGGLGILIMKRCMDEITYTSGPRENECCMIKYLKKK